MTIQIGFDRVRNMTQFARSCNLNLILLIVISIHCLELALIEPTP